MSWFKQIFKKKNQTEDHQQQQQHQKQQHHVSYQSQWQSSPLQQHAANIHQTSQSTIQFNHEQQQLSSDERQTSEILTTLMSDYVSVHQVRITNLKLWQIIEILHQQQIKQSQHQQSTIISFQSINPAIWGKKERLSTFACTLGKRWLDKLISNTQSLVNTKLVPNYTLLLHFLHPYRIPTEHEPCKCSDNINK